MDRIDYLSIYMNKTSYIFEYHKYPLHYLGYIGTSRRLRRFKFHQNRLKLYVPQFEKVAYNIYRPLFNFVECHLKCAVVREILSSDTATMSVLNL